MVLELSSLIYFFNNEKTHFRTIFSLATGATGGAGSVLVSITAQTPEADYGAKKSMFDDIVASYKI